MPSKSREGEATPPSSGADEARDIVVGEPRGTAIFESLCGLFIIVLHTQSIVVGIVSLVFQSLPCSRFGLT